jgi:alpha-beta hydrolase superfamily lysophospholipase
LDGEARTACPTHRGKLAGAVLRRGALYEAVPDGWTEQDDLKQVSLPILGLHGAADPVSPLPRARQLYATAPRAELITIADGRHDSFNDITHRTAAATAVLFLERLRNGNDLRPIAVREYL